MPERWRVRVDQGVCRRSGVCVAIAPTAFVAGADGRSRPRHDVVVADDDVLDAAVSCPVGAIAVSDQATARILAPADATPGTASAGTASAGTASAATASAGTASAGTASPGVGD